MLNNELQRTGRFNKLELIFQRTNPYYVAFDIMRRKISATVQSCYLEKVKLLSNSHDFSSDLKGHKSLIQNPETGEFCLLAHIYYVAQENLKNIFFTTSKSGELILFLEDSVSAKPKHLTKSLIKAICDENAEKMALLTSMNVQNTIFSNQNEDYIILHDMLASKEAFFKALHSNLQKTKGVAIRNTPAQHSPKHKEI